MPADTRNRDLERQHKALLFSSRLPDAAMLPGAPPVLRLIDLAFARALFGNETWGGEDAFDERSRLSRDVLSVSADGRQLVLASEVDLLNQARDGRAECCHQGPFGLREWIFPVHVRGSVVHLVRSGKFRETAFAEVEIKEMAFLSGVPLPRVAEAAQAIPAHSADPTRPETAALRALRDARQLALEEHLRAREAALQQASAEKLVALGTMAEGAAQHVNNLLSVILGYGSLLADKAGLAGEPADLLRKINDAAQRGRRFTQELLALATSSDEEESILSVHQQIQGVVNLLQSRLAGRVKLDAALDAARDLVAAPAGVLHQVLFNLLTNALGGMPAGGLLTIRTSNALDEDGRDSLVLEVSDTGGQSPRAHARKSGRAGQTLASLGEVPPQLTSAFGLIGRLDGSIEVIPDDGLTTRVIVHLPVRDQAVVGEPARRVRRRLATSDIWVADDDSVIREMCRRVLTEDGHRVEELASGEALLARLAETKPDLIVYDFSMPDLDGFELCTRLRQEGVRAPVLLLSGFKADQPDLRETLKLRKTFLLEKPFSFRDMTDMVTVALGETLIEE